MTQVILYTISGVLLAVILWQLVVWMIEIRDKNRKYKAASAKALENRKPLLVVGGPWGGKKYRQWFNKPAHGGGDVCMDIQRQAIADHPYGVVASVTHIPFADKVFGSAFASHLLEHLPTTGDAKKAMNELNRVAEAVFIVYPSRQSIAGWITADHHLWVWQEGNITYFKQRGMAEGSEKNIIISTAGEDE